MNIYRTLIRLIMMYAAETMTLTIEDKEDVRIVERKMRRILEPAKNDESK